MNEIFEFQFEDDIFDNVVNEKIICKTKSDLNIKDELWFLDKSSSCDDYENILKYQMNYYYFTKSYENCYSKAKELFNFLTVNNSVERRNSLECMLYSGIKIGNFDDCFELLANLQQYISISDNLVSYLVICEQLYLAMNDFCKLVAIYKRLLLLIPSSGRYWNALKGLLDNPSLEGVFNDDCRLVIPLLTNVAMLTIEGSKTNEHFITTIFADITKIISQSIIDDVRNPRFVGLEDFSESDQLFQQLFVDCAKFCYNK